MRFYTPAPYIRMLILITLAVFISNCNNGDNDCNADFDPQFLDHAGMAPERVRFVGNDPSADSYSWNIDMVVVEKVEETVTFEVSGLYDASLTARKNNNQCTESTVIEITPFPSVGSNRAISYFENVGATTNLMAKVIDTESQNFLAIPDLPAQGGGLDVDNDGKKIYASPSVLLASCFPNNEELLVFDLPTSIDKYFDLALDPDDNRVYFTVMDNGSFSIKAADMIGNSMNLDEIHSESINAEFFYITNDRKDNILYWVEKGGNVIKRVINGNSSPYITLTGIGVFGDIEYDDSNNRLYFVINSGSTSVIQSFQITTSDETTEVGPFVGIFPFIYMDEDRQEIFWANDTEHTISSKKIGIQGTTILVDNLGPVKGLTVGFYGD